MTSLHTSDIHLTSLPRDSHRLGLLPWLCSAVREHHVDTVFIDGDLTDTKDRHAAKLVNQIVRGLQEIAHLCNVVVLKGNHDYVDPFCPFFGFVNTLHKVSFVSIPIWFDCVVAAASSPCLFLPNTTTPEKDWKRFAGKLNKYQYVFCHQTFKGAQRENGTKSEDGISTDFFKGYKGTVYSGDIHVPQRLGPVTYIGSPYRIDFGDMFTPRVLLVDNKGATKNLRFPCPNKHLVEIDRFGELRMAGDVEIVRGDQVKVRVVLRREDYPVFPKIRDEIKQIAKDSGWDLYGPELRADKDHAHVLNVPTPISGKQKPDDAVREFSKGQKLDGALAAIGLAIVRGVT